MNAVTQRLRGATTVTLPIRTVSEANQREHWAKKAGRVKGQRMATGMRMRAVLAGSRFPLRVLLTRIAPRALDDDNLRGALKAVRDGVADALGVDDRDPGVTWAYAQRRGGKGVYAVEIAVGEREAASGLRSAPGASSGQ